MDSASQHSWRIFAIPGLLALIGYVAFYACDAQLRTRNGPWEVEFLGAPDGTPTLRINQPSLGIRGVEIRFLGEVIPAGTRSLPASVRFDQPLVELPFGRTAFDDLMYLPGTVVLQCFGHEVQLVPSTLYLNRQPHAWAPEDRHELRSDTKLPSLDPPPKAARKR